MVDAALISGLLSNLAPLSNDKFSLFWNFKKEVHNLSSTLSAINAVLKDAERKTVREKDEQTEDWLRKLKDVLYEVRDIMDECSFKDLRLQVKSFNASSSTRIQVINSITQPFSNTWTHLKVGHKIKDVQEKLDQISSERQKLHLRESNHESKIDKFTSSWRETMSLSSTNNQIYGRDKEKKEIIDILLNNTLSVSVAKTISVLPIVGIGGLGKTTLAQMVFNDDQVSNHFDPKIWVCVSDEFDIKLVIKAIIGSNNETSLEKLQKIIQDQLRGKRYLIVLDDVWNEDRDEWNKLSSILDCGSNGAFVLTTTRKKSVAKIMKTIPHFELSSLSENDCWLLFEERAFEHGKPKPPNFINIGKEIARKFKGVPLVAKMLGSQLGFSEDDEKEWCRIRDREIWEISQNEKYDILPILRLSYYDLTYHLRRCFVFCAIFPKDTEIEKDKLIQLWMAHGLIPTIQNQEVEDVGNTIWKELFWRSFFQDEKKNKNWDDIVYTTCKMHDFMHDLAQSIMKDESYTMNDNISRSDGFGRNIRHLTVMVDQLDNTSICSLKKIGGLQSITLHDRDGGNVKKEILSFLKELPSLRVLEVRRCVQYEDLCYVGCLKHLRYLDISYSHMTALPNSICDLLNLQTLKLNYCYELKSLPSDMRDLINLRHLYLEGCNGLNYMPRGMGQLKHLKTLSFLVIGKKERDCQLDEIKELDIRGSLKIKSLGRVSDACIARGISMAKMSSINKLDLEWRSKDEVDDNETKSTRHVKIGEALEIPTSRLKILKMSGYKGVNFPKLRELVSPTIPSPRAFPNLSKIEISDCPKLGALPPHLKALKHVTVSGECSDELLYSISNLTSLTHLSLSFMDERSVLFPASKALKSYGWSTPVPNIDAQLGVCSTFQSLQSLSIVGCDKLMHLFDKGMIMQETLKISAYQKQQKHHHHRRLQGQTERIRLMNSLTELDIYECPELMISVEEFGKLNINNSLRRLTIRGCPKLVCEEEEDEVMVLLGSLRARLGHKKFTVDIFEGEQIWFEVNKSN